MVLGLRSGATATPAGPAGGEAGRRPRAGANRNGKAHTSGENPTRVPERPVPGRKHDALSPLLSDDQTGKLKSYF